MSVNTVSEKKKAFLAQKQKLLQEIKYYEARSEEARAENRSTCENEDSSDSDTEFTVFLNSGPSVSQLKHRKSMLKTCLQATVELTNLVILQSEVNIMVEEPLIDGKCPVADPGVWREATAECRIDLVSFAIMFYTHRADRDFAPTTYHGMQVKLIKPAHEAELSKSVLPAVTRPSDAIEVLRSYAAAHRSRRSSLARLADKFAPTLQMEALPEGGYQIKCSNLLTVQWSLQNRWSPIAPFHHRLVFDLEYMDESYIKRITQVHRQLSDPEVETDERTLLLSKIISICLEAQGPTQVLHDSLSSDPESAKQLEKRRMTLEQEAEVPVMKKKKDTEVMAPPKSLPKKTKPKSKDNVADNRKPQAVKEASDNEGSEKRMKTSEKDGAMSKDNDATSKIVEKSVSSSKNFVATRKSKGSVADYRKSEGGKGTSEIDNVGSEISLKTSEKAAETKQKIAKVVTSASSVASTKVNGVTDNTVEKGVASSKIISNKAKIIKPVTKKVEGDNNKLNPGDKKKITKTTTKTTEIKKNTGISVGVNPKTISAGRNGNAVAIKNVASTENKSADTGNTVEKTKNTARVPTKTMSDKIMTKDGGKVLKKGVSETKVIQKVVKAVKKVTSDNNIKPTSQKSENKYVTSKKNDDNPTESTSKEKVTNKNVASAQISNPSELRAPNVDKTKKPISKLINNKQLLNINQKIKENPLKILNKPTIKPPSTGNIKSVKTGNTEKENKGTNKIVSKIPQKKLPNASQGFMKKVPLRISPRKLIAKPKMPSQVISNQKLDSIRKPTTNIPRPTNKPRSMDTS